MLHLKRPCKFGSFVKNVKEKLCRSYRMSKCVASELLSPEEVLSKANKENCIRLLSFPIHNEFFKSKTKKKAAVLVPLCQYKEDLALLYTVRALHLKVNGGEIAFPGGRFDKFDRDLEKTALRETFEEVGIEPNRVEIWGKGPEIDRTDVKITPFLGYLGKLKSEDIKINPAEVSTVFLASLESLISPENFGSTRFRTDGNYVFQTPVYLKRSRKIWGLTAYITHVILSSLVPEIYKHCIKFKPTIQKAIL